MCRHKPSLLSPSVFKIVSLAAGCRPSLSAILTASSKTLRTLQARQILVQNPQLTKALFQAQILLGMVKPTPAPGAQPGPAPAQETAPQISAPPHMQPQPVQVRLAMNLSVPATCGMSARKTSGHFGS